MRGQRYDRYPKACMFLRIPLSSFGFWSKYGLLKLSKPIFNCQPNIPNQCSLWVSLTSMHCKSTGILCLCGHHKSVWMDGKEQQKVITRRTDHAWCMYLHYSLAYSIAPMGLHFRNINSKIKLRIARFWQRVLSLVPFWVWCLMWLCRAETHETRPAVELYPEITQRLKKLTTIVQGSQD